MPLAWIVFQVIWKCTSSQHGLICERQYNHAICNLNSGKGICMLLQSNCSHSTRQGFISLSSQGCWHQFIYKWKFTSFLLPATSQMDSHNSTFAVRKKKRANNPLNKSISWESSETARQRFAERTLHTRRGGVTTAPPTPPKPPAAESTEAPSLIHTQVQRACCQPSDLMASKL